MNILLALPFILLLTYNLGISTPYIQAGTGTEKLKEKYRKSILRSLKENERLYKILKK